MNIRIKDLLRKYNATLVYNDDLHKKGFNIPINSTSNIIVVNSDLTDEEIEQVILHELGHSANDDEVIGSYKNYLVPRFKMESKANDFMLRELLEKYILTTNTDPTDINCVAFLECEQLPLSLENDVKRILSEKVTKIGMYQLEN